MTKHALLTAPSKGIGSEISKLLIAEGYNLFIVGNRQEELDDLVKELPPIEDLQIRTIPKNLKKKESAYEIYNQLKQEGVDIDVLINEASYGYATVASEEALIYLTFIKLFLKDMILRSSGRILNIASSEGKIRAPFKVFYHENERDRNVEVSDIVIASVLPDGGHQLRDNQSLKNTPSFEQNCKEVAKCGYQAIFNQKPTLLS